MKVRNVRGRDLEIGVTGQVVKAAEAAEVDDDLGARLCEQPANWREVTDRPKARKKTARKSTTEENS